MLQLQNIFYFPKKHFTNSDKLKDIRHVSYQRMIFGTNEIIDDQSGILYPL